MNFLPEKCGLSRAWAPASDDLKDQIRVQLPSSCVSWGESLHLSVPWSPPHKDHEGTRLCEH